MPFPQYSPLGITLMISALLGAAAAGMFFMLAWLAPRLSKPGRRRCRRCGYDMSATPDLRCPECGRQAKSEFHLSTMRTRATKAFAAMGVLLLIASGVATARLETLSGGWASLLPMSWQAEIWRTTGDSRIATRLKDAIVKEKLDDSAKVAVRTAMLARLRVVTPGQHDAGWIFDLLTRLDVPDSDWLEVGNDLRAGKIVVPIQAMQRMQQARPQIGLISSDLVKIAGDSLINSDGTVNDPIADFIIEFATIDDLEHLEQVVRRARSWENHYAVQAMCRLGPEGRRRVVELLGTDASSELHRVVARAIGDLRNDDGYAEMTELHEAAVELVYRDRNEGWSAMERAPDSIVPLIARALEAHPERDPDYLIYILKQRGPSAASALETIGKLAARTDLPEPVRTRWATGFWDVADSITSTFQRHMDDARRVEEFLASNAVPEPHRKRHEEEIAASLAKALAANAAMLEKSRAIAAFAPNRLPEFRAGVAAYESASYEARINFEDLCARNVDAAVAVAERIAETPGEIPAWLIRLALTFDSHASSRREGPLRPFTNRVRAAVAGKRVHPDVQRVATAALPAVAALDARLAAEVGLSVVPGDSVPTAAGSNVPADRE